MAHELINILKEAALETLWPTRCACCDVPGALLCPRCRLNLPYVDTLQACPVCGSPFGRIQCCDCSATLLEPLGRTGPPFDGCVSAVRMNASAGRVIALYKDAGDRGLAKDIAEIMAGVIPPRWLADNPVFTYIPDSAAAFRRRGWDHGELLASTLAAHLESPCLPCFGRPSAKDQRALTREERFENMKEAVCLLPRIRVPAHVILVDDVYTTGSTLFAATDRLKEAGATCVHCVTFARA